MLLFLLTPIACGKEFVFVGGIGGAGKSVIAAAIAIDEAKTKKVLLMSADPLKPMSTIFQSPDTFDGKPTRVAGITSNLEIFEPTFHKVVESGIINFSKIIGESNYAIIGKLPEVQKVLNEYYDPIMKQVSDFLSHVPGLNEVVGLATAIDGLEKGTYDKIIFDSEAIGVTQRVLGILTAFELLVQAADNMSEAFWEKASYLTVWPINSYSGMDDKKLQTAKQIVKLLIAKQKRLFLVVLRKIYDPNYARFSVVTSAEESSVDATSKFIQQVEKIGLKIQDIYINKVYDISISDQELLELEKINSSSSAHQKSIRALRFIKTRREAQNKSISQLDQLESIKGMNRVQVPFVEYGIIGVKNILEFADTVGYGKPREPKVIPAHDDLVLEHEEL